MGNAKKDIPQESQERGWWERWSDRITIIIILILLLGGCTGKGGCTSDAYSSVMSWFSAPDTESAAKRLRPEKSNP